MDDILKNLPQIIEVISHGLMILVVVATFIVQLTPTKSDDEKLMKWLDMIHKAIKWLPTIGVNPKTKELENYYESQKKNGGTNVDSKPQS